MLQAPSIIVGSVLVHVREPGFESHSLAALKAIALTPWHPLSIGVVKDVLIPLDAVM